MKKKCVICDSTFEAKSNATKYCSIKCRGKSPEIQAHIGEVHGKLEIIGAEWGGKQVIVTCKCECGNIKKIRYDGIKSGSVVSCGCVAKQNYFKKEDISGMRFGHLVAICNTGQKKDYCGAYIWECKCDCGNTCYVLSKFLKSGMTKSCGCHSHDTAREHLNKAKDVLKEKYLKDGTNYKTISKVEPNKDGSSGHRNITWDKNRCKWVVALVYQSKSYHIGRFDDISLAIFVRDQARKARLDGNLLEWLEMYRSTKYYTERGIENGRYL